MWSCREGRLYSFALTKTLLALVEAKLEKHSGTIKFDGARASARNFSRCAGGGGVFGCVWPAVLLLLSD
ncbi:uncharacterized protein IUM83_01394 [Phytophthora cinnamomi]|uniref:uncharacterized protein n=1 Tax=Phytophthora cinnamomi TaxID=4785 RepID=UPI003559ED7C|nr:hypothetical protein IUM83_01394 [Phytophthora cinnamomi]